MQIIQATEPGDVTLLACSGSVFGDFACTWKMTGQDADKAIASMKLKLTA